MPTSNKFIMGARYSKTDGTNFFTIRRRNSASNCIVFANFAASNLVRVTTSLDKSCAKFLA